MNYSKWLSNFAAHLTSVPLHFTPGGDFFVSLKKIRLSLQMIFGIRKIGGQIERHKTKN